MNALMILILLAVPGIAENETSPLEVSHLARSIQPGEVVLITVKSQTPLTRMEGKVFEKTFFFNPTTESSKPESARQGPDNYVVRRGDNPSKIASMYGVRVDDLLRWNSLNASSLIHPGQRIRIFSTTESEQSGSARQVPDHHVVRRGDSLSRIASMYGVRVENLKRWNGITGSFIYPGQRIRILSKTTDTVWQGLIGIDLTTPAGDYSVLLGGATSDGTPVKRKYGLHVEHKAFPIRRLTVDEKFVNPPQEMLSRIHQESSRVAEIFATLNLDKIWKHSFLSPVPGAPTSGFGKQSILNGQPRSPHSGTDFEAEEGTSVKSPNQGIVVLASNLYYSGNTVILDHGQGLYSYFAHLSRFGVKEGQMVWHGDRVGDVGATGRVTGAHLHWTVRLNGTRVDPLSLMEVLSNLD